MKFEKAKEILIKFLNGKKYYKKDFDDYNFELYFDKYKYAIISEYSKKPENPEDTEENSFQIKLGIETIREENEITEDYEEIKKVLREREISRHMEELNRINKIGE